VPPRGIGAKSLEEIESRASEERLPLWDALERLLDAAALPARAHAPLQRFREMMVALRQEAPGLGVKRLLERVLEATGYSAALAREDSQESQDRLENLAELLSAAADYEAREEAPTLTGFLDRAALLSDADQVRDDVPVLLMTLHSAKGLEFHAVFLVGLEEGLMPHSRSLASPDALEEERRLCYVGMTRAMERLHLSWAASRQVFGQRRLAEPSRFLDEIPREALEVSGGWRRPEAHRPARRGSLEGGRPRTEPSWEGPAGRIAGPGAEGASPVGPATNAEAAMRPGVRVRHPLFGVGTVLRRDGDGEDLKLTVSFAGVGAKKLVARYAALELL
jgi:DNA helicase-2/ATP-dependent DNA helicase PcrA